VGSGSLPLADGDGERGGEGAEEGKGERGWGESTAWELSSSSGDDERHTFSPMRRGIDRYANVVGVGRSSRVPRCFKCHHLHV